MTGRSVRIAPPALHRTRFGEASRAVSKYQRVQSVCDVKRYDTGISPDPGPCDVVWKLIAASRVVDLIRFTHEIQLRPLLSCDSIHLQPGFNYKSMLSHLQANSNHIRVLINFLPTRDNRLEQQPTEVPQATPTILQENPLRKEAAGE
jgi:hypothetical protein